MVLVVLASNSGNSSSCGSSRGDCFIVVIVVVLASNSGNSSSCGSSRSYCFYSSNSSSTSQ